MNAGDVPDEVEVKLEAPSADTLARIAALRRLGPYRLLSRRAMQLHTIYLDTADRALTRAGVALRVRQAGRHWEATAKWGGRVDGAVHARPELTVPLPGAPSIPFVLPDGPLRTQLSAVVLRRQLRPLLVSDVRRVLRDVTPEAGADDARAAIAELALDTVVLSAPEGQRVLASYHEVEIERRAGATEDLLALTELLQSRFPLVPSAASKFARGVAALSPGVGRFESPPLDPADPVPTAIRTIAANELARIRAEDPGTRLGTETDTLHRQRVAIRRLRAALRAFSCAVPVRTHVRLDGELRWVGEQLGAVRDVDVQLANLAWRCERVDAVTRRRLQPYRRHLDRERRGRRAQLIAAMDSPRYAAALRMLERFAAGRTTSAPRGAATRPLADAARRAIKRSLRRVLRGGNSVGDLPKPDDLHALRIRAKRLRYLLDTLQPLTGSTGRKLSRELARVQDVLGRYHDSIVAAGFVRAFRDAQAGGDADLRRTLTEAADDELRRAGAAQAEFARAWERFTDKSRSRRRRKLLKHLKAAARDACAKAAVPSPAAQVHAPE